MSEKIRFPKRHADGSFCIEVSLPVSTNDPQGFLERVQDWFTQWVEANQIWIRKWEPTERIEELSYAQEFKREPQVISCNSTELKLRLDVQPSARWWKDWMVTRILADFKAAFAEIKGVGHIGDCE
jgi:hypothetical protein